MLKFDISLSLLHVFSFQAEAQAMSTPSESIGSLGQAAEIYADSSQAYLRCFGANPTSNPLVRQAVEGFVARSNAATATFLESLANLQPMVEELGAEAVAAGGDAVSLTLISILLKHMSNYHRDVAAALDTSGAALAQSKRLLGGAAPPPQSAPPIESAKQAQSTGAGPSNGSVAALAAVAMVSTAGAVAEKTDPPSDHEDVAPEKKKKKKKKKAAVEEPAIEPPPAPVVEQPREASQQSTGARRTKASEAPAAKSSPSSPKHVSPTSKKGPRAEAEFLAVQGDVTTTIADTLLSMPNVFSAFEKVVAKAAATGEYFLEPAVDDPASLMNLGAFFTRIWLHGALEDLYLDLLEADKLDIPPFSGVTGPIVVDSEDDLSCLPAAGFRRITTDEITVHTHFAFIDTTHDIKRCLIVHDAIVQNGKKEEMLQVFTPIAPGQSSIVQVKYYAYNAGKKLQKGSKAEAFVITVKDVLIEAGGIEEVDEEVAREAIQAANTPEPQDDDDDLGESQATGAVDDDDERFKAKAPDKSSFMQKAFRISKKVVTAPLNIGVAAGSAVLDVAGGVVKTQTDGLFRKHFPKHAAEELIDSFSCALSNGPIVKQGFLYATSTWLCFKGTVLEASLEIPFEEIREFRKANTGVVFPTAIEIHTFTNEKHLFTSFINRDEALKTLHRIWTDSDGLK